MHCPFCQPKSWEIFHQGELILGLWNGYPVSPGHALLVTRRHLPDWFAATPEEQCELTAAVALARRAIEQKFQPDGYNVGLNCGEAAGQTIPHLHVHVLPRYTDIRPLVEPETRLLIPPTAHPRLKISNFHEALGPALESAQVFDLIGPLSPENLLLIFGAVEGMLKRGGHLRAVLGAPTWSELAVAFPGQVELRVLKELPFCAFRVRNAAGQELAWLGGGGLTGGPAWYYCVQDRDGLREIRRAFEGLLTEPAGG